jgi:cytochrome P450
MTAGTIHQPRLDHPRFKANPYPFFAELRDRAPVFQASLPGRRRAWLVSRYDDVLETLKDARLVKNPRAVPGQVSSAPWIPPFMRPLAENMLDLDGADHIRLRRLVSKAFTPRRIEELETRIGDICRGLLDRLPGSGEADLVESLALPLPVTVIAELLGIPAADRPAFHRWSDRIVAISSATGALAALPSLWFFMRYLRKLVRLKREQADDGLISALAQVEEQGDTLSEDELLAMVTILLIAGHETTVSLIAAGTLALLENPDQLELLRDDPSLMPSAIEELLRFTSPVNIATERYAREPYELAGARIGQGDQVLAVLASANRDPAQFADPDRLRIQREPNRHLAFGQGIHFCLGAPLARLEARIAFTSMLQRLPNLRLSTAAQALHWKGGVFLRGLRELPVSW